VAGAARRNRLIVRRLGQNGLEPELRAIAGRMPFRYIGTNVPKFDRLPESEMASVPKRLEIERVQTGVRMERRILKVLKALAEYKNLTLGDLLEGIVLHAFEGKAPFSAETVRKIAELKDIYELDLDARASHRLKEK
jgi:hypothetical protein